MLCWPARSPLSTSSRFPGGTLNSSTDCTDAICRNLRKATRCMRGSIDGTRSRCHNRSVSLLPNDLITPAVYNVWRHTGQARLPGRRAQSSGANNSFKRPGGRRRSRRRRPGGGCRRRSSGSMLRPVSSAVRRGALPPLMPPQLHPTRLTSTKNSETTRLRVDCEVLVGE